MKEKLKKYFNKDKIFIWICTILIALFVAMSVIFLKNDVEDNKNKQSEISLCDTEINLNTSWTINQDGNLVGNNLLNPDTLNFSSSYYNLSQNNGLFTLVSNGNGNVAFGSFENIYLLGGVTYTISKQNLSYDTDGIGLYFEENGNRYYNQFTPSTSGNYILYLRIQLTYVGTIYFNVMLNEGSTALEWEPYGVWYSESNFDNLQEQFDIVSGQIKPLTISHISSNTLTLNSVDVTSQLGGSIFLSDMNGGIGFYNSDFDAYSSFNASDVNEFNLVSIFNKTYTIYGVTAFVSLSHSGEDYLDISIYRDNQLILTMSDLDSETTQEYMQTYFNQEIQFNRIIMSGRYNPVYSDRQGANYIVDNNNYAFGYQQGYNDSSNYYDSQVSNLTRENSTLTNELNNINSQYEALDTTYNNLLDQYNLIAQNDYTFSELFWSISAVPFGVLTSTFNVNVMGVNLALNYNRLANIYGVTMAYKETF